MPNHVIFVHRATEYRYTELIGRIRPISDDAPAVTVHDDVAADVIATGG